MQLYDPNSREMQKDYEQSDVAHVLRKREWHSYDEMIRWLDKEGDNDRRLTPGEVSHMVEDLTRLKKSKREFISDPDQLYRELKKR